MEKKMISNKEYQEKKSMALSEKIVPLRNIVNVGSLKVGNGDQIYLDDVPLQFSNNGIMDLAKQIGIPPTFVTKCEKTGGTEFRNQLINAISALLGGRGNKKVMLIASPHLGTITDVKSENFKYISNEGLFKVLEGTLNNHKDLHLSDMFVDQRGRVQVTVLNDKQPFHFGKDEDFFAGLGFDNNPKDGTSISQFMLRQICTNGMMTKGDFKMVSGYDDEAIKGLYESIAKSAKYNFLPEAFQQRMQRAQKTDASFAELQLALSWMPNNMRVREQFIPVSYILQDLKSRSVDVAKLNEPQKKNCRVDMKVWDLINVMTDYASHDYGHGMIRNDSREMQKDAARLLYKGAFDTENLVG